VTLFLSLSNQLEGAFSLNRISNDSIPKAVPNFVGVVASLKSLYPELFGRFAQQVTQQDAEACERARSGTLKARKAFFRRNREG